MLGRPEQRHQRFVSRVRNIVSVKCRHIDRLRLVSRHFIFVHMVVKNATHANGRLTRDHRKSLNFVKVKMVSTSDPRVRGRQKHLALTIASNCFKQAAAIVRVELEIDRSLLCRQIGSPRIEQTQVKWIHERRNNATAISIGQPSHSFHQIHHRNRFALRPQLAAGALLNHVPDNPCRLLSMQQIQLAVSSHRWLLTLRDLVSKGAAGRIVERLAVLAVNMRQHQITKLGSRFRSPLTQNLTSLFF